MMNVSFRRPRGFNQEPQRQERRLKKRVVERLVAGLKEFQEAILQTPVYSGKTLINYRWSVGSPVSELRQPIKSPALPGKTSDLALGEEPRRSAQEDILQAEFATLIAAVKSNPYQNVFLRNNTPYFQLVEYGSYARNEGQVNRTPPGGMTRRGETALRVSMEGLLVSVS